jgi:3-phenylpropionate/trans-cinnamate dioxygenase ferredoxin reductase subunit
MATADPSIFAAGDIALAPYGPAGTLSRVEHWAVAERQGHAAARTMLGDEHAGSPEPPFFWTEQYGLTFKAVGFIGGDLAIFFRGSPEEGDFLAGYYRGDTLMGAAALGFDRELFAIGELLRRHRHVPSDFFESDHELPGFD